MLEHLPELVIKSAYPTLGEDPVFGRSLTRAQLEELGARIKAHPDQYVAQKQVMSCTTPALIDDQVQPRRFVVRSYPGRVRRFLRGDGRRPDAHHSVERFAGRLAAARRRQQGHVDSLRRPREPDDAARHLAAARPLQPRRRRSAQPHCRRSLLARPLRGARRGAARASRAPLSSRAIEEDGGEETHATQILWPPRSTPRSVRSPAPSSRAAFIKGVMGDDESVGISGLLAQVHNLARIHRERLSPDSWRILENVHERVVALQARLGRIRGGAGSIFSTIWSSRWPRSSASPPIP